MADERDGFGQDQGIPQQPTKPQRDQQSPTDDLDASAADIEKVKGGRMASSDPCEGGEISKM
jgi:hypothetical protein